MHLAAEPMKGPVSLEKKFEPLILAMLKVDFR